MPRHRLRDAVWASLHAKLVAIPGIWKRDVERLRGFVEAVVYVLRTGVAPREPPSRLPPCGTDDRLCRSWDDLPERFGQPNSLYRRYRRWAQQGIWDALFESGIPEDELETVMVDATIAKAQRFASGARGGGEEDLGRSRGGLTTKIHVLVDRRGRPLCYLLTPGQAADCRYAQALLEGVSFAWLIGDRAYDTDALRAWCAEHGVEAVIPSKRNRKAPIPHDRVRYRTRHRIENLFGRAKDYTRIVLRKDKTSRSYAGFISLAFALINIQLCP
jgi:transposase